MCVYMHIHTPLADFNPEQQQETSSTGLPTLSMFAQDLYIHVGAGRSLLSTCADLLSVHTQLCMSKIMNRTLLLAEPGHREPQQTHSFGFGEYSSHCATGAAVCRSPQQPLGISCQEIARSQDFQPSSSSGFHDPC